MRQYFSHSPFCVRSVFDFFFSNFFIQDAYGNWDASNADYFQLLGTFAPRVLFIIDFPDRRNSVPNMVWFFFVILVHVCVFLLVLHTMRWERGVDRHGAVSFVFSSLVLF